MNRIKCECGHVNPEGTVLCEACGKPIQENQHIDGNNKNNLLNMRYEGSARRSKTYNRSVIDKVWNFFSSVKVGVWLIIVTTVASAVGTIFPQQIYIPPGAVSRDPAIFYEDQYGILGQIYYQLGFHNLYSSWWYLLLIAMIGVSLVICSIDRVVPLHRALKKQSPKRHNMFIRRQRLFSETTNISLDEKKKVIEQLKKRRYKVREIDGHILAEKGRFSRWGPYVNHIGLIIILIAAILRSIPFMHVDDYVWVREGEQRVIPSTNGEYYIKHDSFLLEMYDPDDPRFQQSITMQGGSVTKTYQTNAIVYKEKENTLPGAQTELEEVAKGGIKVNNPLKFDGYALYQSGIKTEFKTMSLKVHEGNDPDEEALGEFTVDLDNPKEVYELDNGFKVVIDSYFPDFYLDDGEPKSKFKNPTNPAFIFFVYPPNSNEAEVSIVGVGFNIPKQEGNIYKLGLTDFSQKYVTGLTVKRDYTLPFFAVGAIIFMIGVVQGMYWYHRRIWLHPEGDNILLAGHTNKNWFGLKRDIETVIEGTKVNMPEDQQEIKGNG